jgi:putative ABC transport system permease protein
MRLKDTAWLSIEALAAQKLRTLLTVLGMVIGVGAVVLLVSLGQGAKNYVLKEFEGLGTNLIIVQPGKSDRKTSFGPPLGAAQRKMTIADVNALEKRAVNLEAVSGIILGTVTARKDESTVNISVFGTNDQFKKILNLEISTGEFFSRDEDEYGRRVIVLGRKIVEKLFGEEVPLGRDVKLNGSQFRVVGTLGSMGDKLGLNFDEMAFIPTHAALKLFNDDKLLGIRAKASLRAGVTDAVEEIKDILKERREGEEDFTVITQVSMMDSLTTILNMLTYMLAGIAAISMIVGGIGIMNIMWVSVIERTQEIGIRRAVGARKRDILQQLLAESLGLSVLSGGLGVVGSLILTYGSYYLYPTFDMRAPVWILVPAFTMAIVVGVIFGVVPAWKASRIETLEALRYE